MIFYIENTIEKTFGFVTRVNGGRHFSSRVFFIVFSCVLVSFRCVFEVSFNLEVLIVNVLDGVRV